MRSVLSVPTENCVQEFALKVFLCHVLMGIYHNTFPCMGTTQWMNGAEVGYMVFFSVASASGDHSACLAYW